MQEIDKNGRMCNNFYPAYVIIIKYLNTFFYFNFKKFFLSALHTKEVFKLLKFNTIKF